MSKNKHSAVESTTNYECIKEMTNNNIISLLEIKDGIAGISALLEDNSCESQPLNPIIDLQKCCLLQGLKALASHLGNEIERIDRTCKNMLNEFKAKEEQS